MFIGVHRGPFLVWNGVGRETKGGELKAGSEAGSLPWLSLMQIPWESENAT